MRDPIRIVILGTGKAGMGIARLLRRNPGFNLAGVYARRAERAGQDLGALNGDEQFWNLLVSHDLSTLLDLARPEIVIQATGSTLVDVRAEIESCLRTGASVISLAEEMTYPAVADPDLAQALHRMAIEHNAAVLGVGLSPGFVQDLLAIVLSGVCNEVSAIRIERINDISAEGPDVLATLGVGLEPAAFAEGVENGTITGYHGAEESLRMIADTLAWEIERVELSHAPLITRLPRRTRHVNVMPGAIAGCRSVATAWRGEVELITIVNQQLVHPYLDSTQARDRIEIKGAPEIQLTLSPELNRDEGSCALAVNMITRVLNAAPGLHTMADLPVPAAVLGDARRNLRDKS